MEEERDYIECECGSLIYGKSIKHAKMLLPEHRRSKRHKENMENKKRREQRKIIDSINKKPRSEEGEKHGDK